MKENTSHSWDHHIAGFDGQDEVVEAAQRRFNRLLMYHTRLALQTWANSSTTLTQGWLRMDLSSKLISIGDISHT